MGKDGRQASGWENLVVDQDEGKEVQQTARKEYGYAYLEWAKQLKANP